MVRVYERSAEAWALELAQALGLAPHGLDALSAALGRARAEGEQIGDDARAMFRAAEIERGAILAMKNEAIAGLNEAVRQRDEAARAAGGAAIQTQRIVAAWLLKAADEYGAHLLVALAGRVSAGEPIQEYVDGELPPALMARAAELPNAQPLPATPCVFCSSPSTAMIPACDACRAPREEEERSA